MSLPRFLRHRTLLGALFACAVLAPAVYALTPAGGAAPKAAAAEGKVPHPPLWKVSDKDNTVYLLGSFHLLKSTDYPLSRDVESAFADAEQLVFEVPPDEMANPANAAKIVAAAAYSNGGTLSSVLPADVRSKLQARVGPQAYAQMDRFEPWFVNLQLAMQTAREMGFQSDQGLDFHLMRRAQEAGKPTSGLETVESQFAMLDATPMNEQIAGLKDFVDSPDEMPKQLNDMHDAWRRSDEAWLTALMLREMRTKTPVTYRLVNVKRNEAWLPAVRALLDNSAKDDTLVVVGTLHLLGEDGLVHKLRAKGYTVQRLCNGCAKR